MFVPWRFAEITMWRLVPDLMDFKAIHILSKAVSSLMTELQWGTYGSENLHTPLIVSDSDCRKLDVLLDMMGTLTRMMDTRINYVTSEGKVVREWIETILELGERYKKEIELLDGLAKDLKFQE